MSFHTEQLSVNRLFGTPDMSVANRLLPRGTSEVHLDPSRAELGLGTRPEDRVRNNQTIGRNRQRGHLENEFMGNRVGSPTATRKYGGATLLDRGRVSVVGQPAGYSEMSALVVATELPDPDPEVLMTIQDQVVQTRYPIDLPDSTRLAYVTAKLVGLQTAHGLADETQKPIVIEHITPDVKTDEIKFPRSVPWAHASIGNIDMDTITTDRKDIHHLDAERMTLGPEFNALQALYMFTYLQTVLSESSYATEIDRLDVRPRSIEPFGYSIVFDITPSELTDSGNVRFVSAVLDAEHSALAAFENTDCWSNLPAAIQSGGEMLRKKPQPATRAYTHIGSEGLLEKVSSGIVYSHAGGMEAAGVVLRRGPQFERRHDPSHVEHFRRTSGQNIENAVKQMGLAT